MSNNVIFHSSPPKVQLLGQLPLQATIPMVQHYKSIKNITKLITDYNCLKLITIGLIVFTQLGFDRNTLIYVYKGL